MHKGRRYRLYFWLMILSGVVLAGALIFTSFRTVQTDRRFSQLVLDENKAFLVNTLRFGHGMMASMRSEQYGELIDLALRNKFIRYLAILDDEGEVIAQSRAPASLKIRGSYDVGQLADGRVLQETNDLLLIAYKAEEAPPAEMPMMHGFHRMGPPMEDDRRPSWYLVALDISAFERHYQNMLIQTMITGTIIVLFAILIVVFFGIVQRYELAHTSIERLQKIKGVLSNFVPETAKRIIEKDPSKALLDKYLQDATILFLDIEGFTRLVQKYPQERVNRAIESYFSDFFDLIRKREGDINETAGDGMMVIFLHADPKQHARNAVHAAQEIQRHCQMQSNPGHPDLFPIRVNIGISSGEVYLGSTKMRGTGGDRWTFTASGPVTILAARLSDYGSGGQILIGEETARRIEKDCSMKQLGRLQLKNIEDSGEIYQVCS